MCSVEVHLIQIRLTRIFCYFKLFWIPAITISAHTTNDSIFFLIYDFELSGLHCSSISHVCYSYFIPVLIFAWLHNNSAAMAMHVAANNILSQRFQAFERTPIYSCWQSLEQRQRLWSVRSIILMVISFKIRLDDNYNYGF